MDATTGFFHDDIDYKDIYTCAMYSRAVYDEESTIKEKYGDGVAVFQVPNSQVQFMIVKDTQAERQWVVVRGTKNYKNAFVDGRIKIIKEPRLGMYIHGGFLRSAQEIHEKIIPHIDRKQEIRFTGHSLGGAVALILAAFFHQEAEGYNVGRTITFGQPMITDRNGVKRLNKYDILRVVNHWDPVAILPLILSRTHFELVPTIFYHHVGYQLTLFDQHPPKLTPPARLIRLLIGYRRLIANHFMDLYLERLQSHIGLPDSI